MKNSWKYLPWIVGILMIMGVVAVGAEIIEESKPQQSRQQTYSAYLTVPELYTYERISVAVDSTALDLLRQINIQNPKLKLVTKDYVGMGTLVEGMVGKDNGTDGKYWTYYVNGEMAQVGAGNYVIKDNDQIEWKFFKE